MPRAAWAFANCDSAAWPGTPDPSRICVNDAFRSDRLYELVYTAKDPLVLGVGLAATRDIVSFFRHARADASGTPNPVAGAVETRSASETRSPAISSALHHLGFNQDTRNRIVWDGAFPRIAARQTPINVRFALPGAAGSTSPAAMASSGGRITRPRRVAEGGGSPRSVHRDEDLPKIVEAFGSSEFWGLRMSPDLIGTDATADLPLPADVRRYYYPSTRTAAAAAVSRSTVRRPRTASARCRAIQTRKPSRPRLTRAGRMGDKGTPPPPSRYPTLANGDLVVPTRRTRYARHPGAAFQ